MAVNNVGLKNICADAAILKLLAVINVALHIIGLIFVQLWIRPGTPLVSLSERSAYLAGHPLGWQLGWGIWMLCALCLMAFCAALAHQLPQHYTIANLAVIIVCAGATIDIFCDAILLAALPLIASWGAASHQLLLLMERVTNLGGTIVANGFYAIAILLLTICMRARGDRAAQISGYATFIFGMLMVASGFTGVTLHLEIATGPTIISFCAWTLLVARSFSSIESRNNI
jgi:hypothetical protein